MVSVPPSCAFAPIPIPSHEYDPNWFFAAMPHNQGFSRPKGNSPQEGDGEMGHSDTGG